jgi:UDP-glucose 4-epimerase
VRGRRPAPLRDDLDDAGLRRASQNPNFLVEDAELRGHRDSRFVNDTLRAEKQVQRFAKEHPAVEVAILRFAPILGPTISNMFTRFFARPVAPVMLGHDPLMQFVHEKDAAFALKAVEARGRPFNIVGRACSVRRCSPCSVACRCRCRLVARQLSKCCGQRLLARTVFLDFLLYVCADGAGRTELASRPAYIKRTILDPRRAEDGATDVARAKE